jgi:excisionase family DNA binding protein
MVDMPTKLATRTPSRPELLLTKPEAAAALNVPLRFVERMVTERRIRFVKLGRYIRIPESAVEDALTSGTVAELQMSPRRTR